MALHNTNYLYLLFRFYFHTNGGIGAPLPIELISFIQVESGSVNVLKWITASELNTAYFEVQRSTVSGNWGAIGRLMAAGNSTAQLKYDFTDNNPPDRSELLSIKNS